MINILFLFIYLLIYRQIFKSIRSENYWMMVVNVLFLVTFSPMMQYIYYPLYKLDAILGIRQLPFARVWLEYVQTIVLLYIYSKIPGNFVNLRVKIIVISYMVLNTFQFFMADDIIRSINGYWLSVVNPSIFFLIVHKVTSNNYIKESEITNGLFRYMTYLLVFYFAISIFNFFRGDAEIDSDFEGLYIYGLGNGLGIFRSRILMTVLFFFLPFFFLPKSRQMFCMVSNKEFLFVGISIFLILLQCNSRTMYAVIALIVIIMIVMNPYKNRMSMVKLLICIMVMTTIVNTITTGNSISEIVESRFTNQGETVLESAQNDERLIIWENAKKLSEESCYLGIGFSHFCLRYEGRAGRYSNAHSMYYTTLSERGLGALLWLIYIICYIIATSFLKMRQRLLSLPGVFMIGTICFAISVYTGEDLFNISQVAYSLPPYFIFLVASICISYNNIESDEELY